MKIKDDNKMPALSKNIKAFAKKKIEVGVFGQEISLIAAVNEFGAAITVTEKMRNYLRFMGLFLKKKTTSINIPERSFIRSSFDDKKVVASAFKFAQNAFDINKNADQSMNALGVKMAANIKKKIASNIPPGNHPFTKEQKGGKSKTLINHGTLLNSVRHKIV